MNFNSEVKLKQTAQRDPSFYKVIQTLFHAEEMEKTIISNTDYMLWLEHFTSTYPSFSDTDWLYNHDNISEDDSEKVDDLIHFFHAIKDYAYRNFIPIYHEDFDTYLFISFNNIGYKIGVMAGQGSFIFCDRHDISSEYVFIDFNDIMNNKKQEHVDNINSKLDSVSGIIKELLELGVPKDTIRRRIEKQLK